MKNSSTFLAYLLIAFIAYWSFTDMLPKYNSKKYNSKQNISNFSIENALFHLKNISYQSHFVGSKSHKDVQKYIINELEKLNLQPFIQHQRVYNKKWKAGTLADNILVKIKGSESGKSLLILTHYDSSPHSSLGASDAGSGVVTILEGVRAFLEKGEKPKNDIIILFSDAEELGLLGAKAFVEHHPWAKNVGLVLNFEARGSGGPSFMLIETNGKNGKLISEFKKAAVSYPVANSLLYSVYKLLPNDTDLTVFREIGDINGFNFAFIDDHFDYHTAQDSYERLDRETLLHQADYLTKTLNYFSNSDLNSFESDEDYVYLNFPFFKLISYPFSWNFPLLIIAAALFLFILIVGFLLQKINIKEIFIGFIPFLFSLILCGAISFGLWKLLLILHPSYQDMLHGFTYNGYTYITAFVLLNGYLFLTIYNRYLKKYSISNLLIAPIFIWLLLNAIIYQKLQGASFFIIPVYLSLLMVSMLLFRQISKNALPLIAVIISFPTIYIFAPLIKTFPVGLGLKNIFISALFLVLVLGLLLPVFFQPKSRVRLTKILGISFLLTFIWASFQSDFTIDKKKPNSLVYIQNNDSNKAFFATYNKTLDSFTKQLFDYKTQKSTIENANSSSKYKTEFLYTKETDFREIPVAKINTTTDTIINSKRFVVFEIIPQRNIQQLKLITKENIVLNNFKVNDLIFNSGEDYDANKGTFFSYFYGHENKKLTVSFNVDKDIKLELLTKEISYDLLSNSNFKLIQRNEKMMPMPFVVNDAIICIQSIKI